MHAIPTVIQDRADAHVMSELLYELAVAQRHADLYRALGYEAQLAQWDDTAARCEQALDTLAALQSGLGANVVRLRQQLRPVPTLAELLDKGDRPEGA